MGAGSGTPTGKVERHAERQGPLWGRRGACLEPAAAAGTVRHKRNAPVVHTCLLGVHAKVLNLGERDGLVLGRALVRRPALTHTRTEGTHRPHARSPDTTRRLRSEGSEEPRRRQRNDPGPFMHGNLCVLGGAWSRAAGRPVKTSPPTDHTDIASKSRKRACRWARAEVEVASLVSLGVRPEGADLHLAAGHGADWVHHHGQPRLLRRDTPRTTHRP